VATDNKVLADCISTDIDSVKESVIAGYMILGTDKLPLIYRVFD